jgi:hypothetical protein
MPIFYDPKLPPPYYDVNSEKHREATQLETAAPPSQPFQSPLP